MLAHPIPTATLSHMDGLLLCTQRAYHRMIWLVAEPAVVAQQVLQALAAQYGATSINLGLEVTDALSPLSTAQRRTQIGTTLERILATPADKPHFLTHLEVLFEPSLAISVGRQLKQLSRGSNGLVVVWPGWWVGKSLIYAVAGHAEHQVHFPGAVPVVALANDFSIKTASSTPGPRRSPVA